MNAKLTTCSALGFASRMWIAIGVVAISLAPSPAFACNMIHGYVLNAFRVRSIERIPFVIDLVVIILVEFWLYGLFLRHCKHWKALLYATIVNVASSLAISLLFHVIGNQFDTDSSWHDRLHAKVYGNGGLRFLIERGIPLLWYLGAAIVVEWPVSRLLTRQQVSRWKLLLVVLVVNTMSYVVASVSEHFMLTPWYMHLSEKDAQLRVDWQKPDLLQEAGGRIFTLIEEELEDGSVKAERRYAGLTVDGKVMPSGPLGYRLQYFDLGDGEWHSVTNSPALCPNLWSLTTNRLAFLDTNAVRVVHFPSMVPLSTIKCEGSARGPLREIALSPDGSKLAISIVDSWLTRKAGGSDVHRFTRNRVLLYVVGSGDRIRECSRWAVDGPLFWTADSAEVLFSSAIDSSELEQGLISVERFRESAGGRIHYGVDPKLPQGLFVAPAESGDATLFRAGLSPVSQSGNVLMWVKYFAFWSPRLELLDIDTGNHREIPIKGLGGWNHLLQLSPDGRFLCAETQLAWYTAPAIIDLRDTQRRHIVSDRPLIARPVRAMQFVWLPVRSAGHEDGEPSVR